jgi:IS5 family transposase
VLVPSSAKSSPVKGIGAIQAATWEAINRARRSSAAEAQLERGRVVRLDGTVTAALRHEPSDGSLLGDAVRVMVRLLRDAQAWVGGSARAWRDHRRATKRRARDIQYTRGRPQGDLTRPPAASASARHGQQSRMLVGTGARLVLLKRRMVVRFRVSR